MIYDKNIAHKVAEYLLEIKAIEMNPKELFTWSSGIESPIYCDNRKTLAFPSIRTYIKNSFKTLVNEVFEDIDAISGVATAGIAHGALLAEALQLPFSYVRSKPKEHGRRNQIEGSVLKDEKVVLVEDLFSTGGSSINAVNALRSVEVNVVGVIAIFNYGFKKVDEEFKKINCPFYSLSNFQACIDILKKKNIYSDDEISFMMEWSRTMG